MSKLVVIALFFFPLLVSVLTVKSIFKDPSLDTNKKLLWIVTVILLPLVGAIIYFFFYKREERHIK